MTRAHRFFWERKTDEKSNLRELVIWRINPSPGHPEGVRCRLALIRHGESVPAVLYDNHLPKGHHRHFEGVEEAYKFVDVEQLIADFMADIARVAGEDS